MRVFLLGTGYVGGELMRRLSNKASLWVSTTTDSKVGVLERFADRVELLYGHETEKLADLLQLCDALVISAAPTKGNDYVSTYWKTAESIQHVLKNRTYPFYLLYLSSTGIYGDHGGTWVDERSERKIHNERTAALSKTEEIYLNLENDLVTSCILRLGGIYGPGRELIKRAVQMAKRAMSGNGSEPTNHVHLDDIIRAIQFCMEKRFQGIFNLVNDDHPSRKELYETLCAQQNLPSPIWQNNEIQHSNCKVSNQKIKQTGFSFLHPHLDFFQNNDDRKKNM